MHWLQPFLHRIIGAAVCGCPFCRRAVGPFRGSVACCTPIGIALLVVVLLPLPAWPQTVGELLSDPSIFDRQEVRITGQVTTLIIEEGDEPYTKFKLQDESGMIPVFMRGAQQINRAETYQIDGVFLVKPSGDGSTEISGIVAKTIQPVEGDSARVSAGASELEAEYQEREPSETLSETLSTDAPSTTVGELLDYPSFFDRQEVSATGRVSRLTIEEGERPYTKFKLQDESGSIPVFMHGAKRLTEGATYHVDGVYVVKPTRDGSGQVSGIVAKAIEPIESGESVDSVEETPTLVAESPESDEEVPDSVEPVVYDAPVYTVGELLSDPPGFDRQLVSVTGQVTTLTTRYGKKTYRKFKLQDESGSIPVFIQGTPSFNQGQICRVTGVFLVKKAHDGALLISGIKADAVAKVDDAPYREWRSVVFQSHSRRRRTRTDGGVPMGFDIPE